MDVSRLSEEPVFLAAPLAVEAQRAGKVARMGYLAPNLAAANPNGEIRGLRAQ